MNARALPRVPSRALLLSVLLFAPTLHAAPTGSQTKECIAAFDNGQHQKTDHHLKEAQQTLLACTRETCPSVLRADCAEVLRSVQNALPSVVLAADDAGKDVTDVKVTNGNDVLAASLDSKAVELDPGMYDLKFERGKNAPITVHVVLREGEKARVVKASFNPKKPETSPQFKVVTPPRSTPGYVVPGIGVALGVAGFVVAGLSRLSFNSQVDDLATNCAPNCSQDQRADVSNTLVRGNIALGVGIGGLVIAAATWFIFSPQTKLVPAGSSAALTW